MDDNLKLGNQLCFPIYLCSKEIIRKYTLFLKEIDLTYTQYVVMLCLWEKGKCNVTDLGKIILLDSSTLTPLLKKLEGKGFIRRKKSRVDERNLIITLTEKGEELKNKALSIPDKIDGFISLNDEEKKTLYKLIYKMLINLERK